MIRKTKSDQLNRIGLEIDPSDPGLSDASSSGGANNHAPPTVLVVDDDIQLCHSIADAVEAAGYRVFRAHDGNAGLALAVVKRPDLMILDTRMPRRSGYLVLEHLLHETDRCCPVIMLSEREGERHRTYAGLLGVQHFLAKPIQIEKLVALVGQMFQQSA